MPMFLFLIAGLLAFTRLFFGVDFYDESYYLAMALRFAKGDQPFVDELALNQTSALLVEPLVSLFLTHTEQTQGLVLFTRLLYFSFSVFVFLVLYDVLRLKFGRNVALLASLTQLAFVPFGIPNLCYNTLGMGFFSLGLFAIIRYHWSPHRGVLFLAGLSLGFSVLCYPTMFFGALTLLACFAKYGGAPQRLILALFFTGLLAGVSVLPQFWGAFWKIQNTIFYSLTAYNYGGGSEKWSFLAKHLGIWLSSKWTILFFASLFVSMLLHKQTRLSLVLLGLSFVVLVPVIWVSGRGLGEYYVLFVGLAGPMAFWHSKCRESSDLLFLVWIPSVVAGLGSAWSSTNGITNMAIGFFPGFVATLTILFRIVQFRTQSLGNRRLGFLSPVISVLPIGVLFATYYSFAYGEGPLRDCTQQIKQGPYQGLWATAKTERFLNQITNSIAQQETSPGRIVFYEFPAGYLLTSMKSAAADSWMRRDSKRKDVYYQRYLRYAHQSNVVYSVFRQAPGVYLVPPFRGDIWENYLHQTHRLVSQVWEDQQGFEIYRPRAKADLPKAS